MLKVISADKRAIVFKSIKVGRVHHDNQKHESLCRSIGRKESSTTSLVSNGISMTQGSMVSLNEVPWLKNLQYAENEVSNDTLICY